MLQMPRRRRKNVLSYKVRQQFLLQLRFVNDAFYSYLNANDLGKVLNVYKRKYLLWIENCNLVTFPDPATGGERRKQRRNGRAVTASDAHRPVGRRTNCPAGNQPNCPLAERTSRPAVLRTHDTAVLLTTAAHA